MSWLSRAFTGPSEQRAAFGTYAAAIPPPGEIGVHVGPLTAMQSMAVFRCVTILSDSVATLPLDAYRKPSERVRKLISPQPKIVARPWPYLTLSSWLWCVMQSLAVRGNAFLHVQSRDNLDYPQSLLPLHPDSVDAQPRDDGDWTRPVYTVGGLKVPSDDIVHIRRFPITGQVLGLSPIQQAAQGIGLALAAETFGYRYFKDAAQPSSVLETDKDLTPDAVLHTQRQWIATQGGRRRPAVLSGGFKWRPISITPEESQFLATRQFQRGEIAMMFGVPPHMIGDTSKATSWGSGIESMGIGFVTYTLRPWLKCLEDALTDEIPRGQFVQFNIDGLLRGDQKSRWEAYQLGRNIGVYSVNEIREREDLEPVEDGDGRIQAVNYGPLGFIPKGASKAEPADDEPADEPAADDPDPQDPDEGDETDEPGDDDRDLEGVPLELRQSWEYMTAAERRAVRNMPAEQRSNWIWMSEAERQIQIMQAELVRAQRRPRLRRADSQQLSARKRRRKQAGGR